VAASGLVIPADTNLWGAGHAVPPEPGGAGAGVLPPPIEPGNGQLPGAYRDNVGSITATVLVE
jgi:hypothetical protein